MIKNILLYVLVASSVATYGVLFLGIRILLAKGEQLSLSDITNLKAYGLRFIDISRFWRCHPHANTISVLSKREDLMGFDISLNFLSIQTLSSLFVLRNKLIDTFISLW